MRPTSRPAFSPSRRVSPPRGGRYVSRIGLRLPGLSLVVVAILLASASLVAVPHSVGSAGPASAPAADTAMSSLSPWVTLSGLSLPPGLAYGAPLPPTANVAGSLGFNSPNPSGAAKVATEISDPGSALYGHFLTGDEFEAAFGPSPTQQASLAQYLDGYGISVSVVSALLWNVHGTAADMDAAFDTTFVRAVAPDGHAGTAPADPLHLPSNLATGVDALGAFQNALPPQPVDVNAPTPEARTPAAAPSQSGLTLTLSNPFDIVTPGTGVHFDPPSGVNQSYTLNISGGSPPYTVVWNWGDGTVATASISTNTLTLSHDYYEPSQVDLCGPSCTGINVSVNDSAGDVGSYSVPVYPGASPAEVQSFYNVLPLARLGFSGQGTTIGLDEMCDPTYATSGYLSDFDAFSAQFGLPLATPSTLHLIGSGDSDANCAVNGGGSQGWAGETLLDMEWVHALAPNASIAVDLSASVVDEGDALWTDLSNGVFIDSNSWGCPYWDNASGCDYSWTVWEQAAAQGESFLTASGDCGAYSESNPPADTSFGLGVGGTSIYPTPAGTFGFETAWNGTNASSESQCAATGANDDGSTGGYSNGGGGNASVPAPAFQIGMTGFSSPYRGVPDVSAIGGTWVEKYINGYWTRTAGTSLASPSWAAMLDLVYQYNGTAGHPNGLADNMLYAIAKSANYTVGFHDITVGNNINDGVGYGATPGWDPVTGLGSPDLANLAMLNAAAGGNSCSLAPLTATLEANTTEGPAGLSVYFGVDAAGGTDALSGYSYAWNFGDGTLVTDSPSATATHVYSHPGAFYASVTVSAVGPSGSTSSTTNTLPIEVTGSDAIPTPLTAIVGANLLRGVTPLSVQFSGLGVGGTGPYTYAWTFGDGGTGSAPSPAYVYTDSGFFTAVLTVTDHTGATAHASLAVRSGAACSEPLSVFGPFASRTTADVGQNVSFSATGAGGSGGFSDVWTVTPSSGLRCSDSGPTSLNCTVQDAGNWTVNATLKDSSGDTANSGYAALTTFADPTAPAPTANRTSVDVGQSVQFLEAADLGSGGYAYAWSGLPAGCAAADTDSIICSPSAVGTASVKVNVTDSDGVWDESAALGFQVYGLPTVSVNVSFSAVDLGQSDTFGAVATGGTGVYAYAWSGPLAAGCGAAASGVITCTPVSSGNFTLSVTVTDSNGGRAESDSPSMTVLPDPQILTFAASPGTVPLGENVTFAVDAAGGLAPYSYSYTGLPAGCTSSNTASLACTPSATGTFSVTVTLSDARGVTRHVSTTLVVNPAPSSGGSSTSSTLPVTDWAILGGVAAAVVIASVLVLRTRRGRPPS